MLIDYYSLLLAYSQRANKIMSITERQARIVCGLKGWLDHAVEKEEAMYNIQQ
jgi:hypothetical protein